MWCIRNSEGWFWSNEIGWVDFDGRDVFTDDEKSYLHLPIDGKWCKIERVN